MVGRHELFDGLAAQFVAATLLGVPAGPPLDRIAAGERFVRL